MFIYVFICVIYIYESTYIMQRHVCMCICIWSCIYVSYAFMNTSGEATMLK